MKQREPLSVFYFLRGWNLENKSRYLKKVKEVTFLASDIAIASCTPPPFPVF